MNAPVEINQTRRMTRDRWARVEAIQGNDAVVVIIAQRVGDRVVAPLRKLTIDTGRLAKDSIVEDAPPLSPPDFREAVIDAVAQTVTLDGVTVPYHVTSSGVRVGTSPDGAMHTLNLTVLVGNVVHARPAGGA